MNISVHLGSLIVATVTAVAVVSVPSASAGPRAASAQVSAPVPRLNWTGCDAIYQCATAKVPLDYGDPDGKTIDLALLKRPAGRPGSKIGTLFINPGGPGGNFAGTAGRVQFGAITAALGPRLHERFDMVGIDPRGTGGSTPLVCKAAPGVPPVSAPADAWPTGQQQYDHWFAYAAYMRASCAATGGDILDHMSTADQARDLDLIRQAAGDARLSYYGLSYGSFLGETYAALFPGRVRAMAIDGVVDPVAMATGRPGDENDPSWARAGSAEGAQEALDSVLARCDRAGVLTCPLAGKAKARWDRVRKSLAREPISLPGLKLDDKQFVSLTQMAMSMDHIAGLPLPAIPVLADATKIIDVLRFGLSEPAGTRAKHAPGDPKDAPLDRLARLIKQIQDAAARYGATAKQQQDDDVTNGYGAIWGISCVDSANPGDEQRWITVGEQQDAKAPGFGPRWTWLAPQCANWPGSAADAYRGPFKVTTSTPPLIITTSHDPNTNITGARAANKLLPGSRIIDVRTWGHTALGKSTRCLTRATDTYLLTQRPPETDLVCQPDSVPWG